MDSKGLARRGAEEDERALREVQQIYTRIDRTEHHVSWQANPHAAEYARNAIAIPAEESTKQARETTYQRLIVAGVAVGGVLAFKWIPDARTEIVILLCGLLGVQGVIEILRSRLRPRSGGSDPPASRELGQ